MIPEPLWQISVTTAREAEEAVGGLLERLFGQPASIYAAEEESVSVATVYSSQKAALVQSKRDALEAGLKFLANCDLDVGPAKIVIRKVPREDWSTSWKKYFKILEIGRALLIKPSWNKRQARPGQAVVTLDPGLSFGTGQHPTTAFCLEQIVKSRKTGQAQSFLDIGSGSGILAIAAAKLGYKPVRALDNDPVAVRVAKANARKNRVDHKLEIVQEDLTQLPAQAEEPYDVVCANLIQDLLLGESKRITKRLQPGGKLVLAGLLDSQFSEVQAHYEKAGFTLDKTRSQQGWTSGSLIAPS